MQAVKRLRGDPNADIPSTSNVTGEFGVAKAIRGASQYRLVLRKHAVNGKQLAQAQSEAVKAGQEYVRSELEVVVNEREIKALRDMRGQYQGQDEIYEQAEAKFFNRLLSLKTSFMIELRNLVWAYKYWSLKDSQVVLDSQKSAAEFTADLAFYDHEINEANSGYSTDFQRT